MRPLEIKNGTFVSWLLLAGLPIFVWQVKIGWTHLFMTSFIDHTLRFAGAVAFGMLDVFITLDIAISCICSIRRSRRRIIVNDEGIQSEFKGSPGESIAWSDLVALRSVNFSGGIDAIDSVGRVRVRLPISFLLLNALAPVLDLQLGNHPFSEVNFTSSMRLVPQHLTVSMYVVSGCLLFLAYAAFIAKVLWLMIGFGLVAVLLIAVSAALGKSNVSILVGEGLVRFQRPYFAPKVYRLDTVAEIEICAMYSILYVQLSRPGGRPAGIPLFGNNNILWYRTLRSAWMQTQIARPHDATT